MKFTELGSEVDEQIEKYVDKVNEVILRRIPQTKSIILGGGFGRGEGSVEVRDGKLIPVNDFDMYLITDRSVSEDVLNRVANEAVAELDLGQIGTDFFIFDRGLHADTFYIDLKALPISKLPKLPPMIRYFELRNASHVVYGEDYRSLMPNYDVADLPLAEGFRLLLNRMAMLSLYFSMDFTRRDMTPAEKHGLLYLASKSLIGSCGALLQLNGQYVPTYRGRLAALRATYCKDFPELYERLPDLPDRVEEALDFKFRPDFGRSVDPFAYWTSCKQVIGETTKFFASRYFGQAVDEYDQLSELIYDRMWRIYYQPYLQHFIQANFGLAVEETLSSRVLMSYLNLLYFWRLRKSRRIWYPRILFNHRGPDTIMLSAMVRILYSVDEHGNIDRDMLLEGGKTLRRTFPVVCGNGDDKIDLWNTINNSFADSYVLFFFLKIV